MSGHNLVIEKSDTHNKQNKTIVDGIKAGIFGSIKGKEIARIDRDRWWGGLRGPEKITFEDGSSVIFKCDIRHYWSANNPDTAIRDAIVFQIDKAVELGLVPKTMVIDDTINNVRYNGSAQDWIQDAKEGYQIERFTSEQRKDYERLKVFDFVIGNSDRHLENVLFTDDNKIHAIDNSACLIISKDEDILSFPNSTICFFCSWIVHDISHIAELIENFYKNRDKILSLLDKYIHDNTKTAELMVISRINYLYKVLKEKKLFPRKYLEWRKELDVEVRNILRNYVSSSPEGK
ncbi:MAG: hypothetical protein E3K36_05165 [Candidatus Brocadia sp.]|nr:hypothetical protein [Candidatus Brocadia sp.]